MGAGSGGIGPLVTGGRVKDQMIAPKQTAKRTAPKTLMRVAGVFVISLESP